jgi:hypothetical protein
MLSIPGDGGPYGREYWRPMHEFFAKVMWFGIGLASGLFFGRIFGKYAG